VSRRYTGAEALALRELEAASNHAETATSRVIRDLAATVEALEDERDALRRQLALERGDESAALPGWHWNPHVLYWWSDHGWGIWRATTLSWTTWLGRIKRDYDDCPIDMRDSKGFRTVWDAMIAAPPVQATGGEVSP
jgi:hypothetical protein